MALKAVYGRFSNPLIGLMIGRCFGLLLCRSAASTVVSSSVALSVRLRSLYRSALSFHRSADRSAYDRFIGHLLDLSVGVLVG